MSNVIGIDLGDRNSHYCMLGKHGTWLKKDVCKARLQHFRSILESCKQV